MRGPEQGAGRSRSHDGGAAEDRPRSRLLLPQSPWLSVAFLVLASAPVEAIGTAACGDPLGLVRLLALLGACSLRRLARRIRSRERRTLEVRQRAAAVAGWLRAWRWSRLLAAAPVLAGALGGALAIRLLARQDARIGPLTVRLAAWPSLHAASTLAVPPFGTVTADTHEGLLAVRATLDNVTLPR
jgi:hypothetical protein